MLETARGLADELAQGVDEGMELRRLPDATWNTLLGNGFVRALQPKRWGGGEVPFLEFVDTCIEISRANASAGWVAGVIGVHPWQLALFEEQAQEEMWGTDPSTMHSSSYAPTGKAEEVDGGYRVTGRWSFSSGSDHCHGVNLGAAAKPVEIMPGFEVPDFRSFLFYPGQYTIVDTWNTSGMRGTGSKDIVVDDVFVPTYRTQSHLDYMLNRPLPGQVKNDGPLYRLPWACVFNQALASSLLGAAKGYLETWVTETLPRVQRSGKVADDPLVQYRLATAMYDVDAAITKLRSDATEMWEAGVADLSLSREARTAIRWNANRGCEIVGKAITDLHHQGSGRTIFLDHPLQRGFQDIMGMLGHTFLSPDQLGRSVGALRLGSIPSEMMV